MVANNMRARDIETVRWEHGKALFGGDRSARAELFGHPRHLMNKTSLAGWRYFLFNLHSQILENLLMACASLGCNTAGCNNLALAQSLRCTGKASVRLSPPLMTAIKDRRHKAVLSNIPTGPCHRCGQDTALYLAALQRVVPSSHWVF